MPTIASRSCGRLETWRSAARWQLRPQAVRGGDDADAAQLAALDLAEQCLDREGIGQAQAEGVVGPLSVIDDRVGCRPGGQQRQAQCMQDGKLLEYDRRELSAHEADHAGLRGQALDVGHAAGRDTAVVGGDQLQRSPAEHTTTRV